MDRMNRPGIRNFVASAFRAWQQAGVAFLILRNYEDLPDASTSDIDVLVGADHLLEVEKILLRSAKAAGFLLHNRSKFASLLLQFSHEASGEQVSFDLFRDLKWRGFDFLCCEDFLPMRIQRQLFATPHPGHEAVASLMGNLIFHGRVKEKYHASISAGFRAAPDAARQLLAKSYGEELAGEVAQLAVDEKWSNIELLAGALRRNLILLQTRRHPFKLLRSWLADAARIAGRFHGAPGIVIALCGPDGCGKSTVGPLLIESLRPTFSPSKGRQIHWKPRVFSRGNPEATQAATDPHGRPPRNAVASLAYFVFHWVEFLLGWPLRVLPVRFKGGLVLIDRHYYDFFVDQRRYRLQVPATAVRCGYALLPKPDLVFLLDAPPEILRRRKEEVASEETVRQRNAYLELVKGLANGVVLDATQPPEKVAAELRKATLGFMVARTSKRTG
jgi:thymidylate kinase